MTLFIKFKLSKRLNTQDAEEKYFKTFETIDQLHQS